MWSKYGSAEEHVAADQLQPAAGVAGPVVAAVARADPLAARDAQRFEAVSCRPTRCPAISATPVGKLRPSQPRHQLADLGRRVLPVAVERADHRAAGEADAAVDRRRLPGARRVLHQPQHRKRLRAAPAPGGGIVGRAVVDVDHLVGPEVGAGRGDRLGDEVDVLGLVLERHDDREPGSFAGSVGGGMAGVSPRPCAGRAPGLIA